MKKILKNSLMFMLVIFALFIGVNSANITASAASDDELFKAYVKSNFKVLASSKVTDKNATGILCYFIKDLDSDKSKEMILFERKTNGILMYLYEIEGGKVVSKGSADRIISGTGAGNYATTTCAYLDGNTIRIDSDCINYGGSSSMSFYVAYTVKNNKLNKVSHFEASEFPRYGSSVYKNAVTNKSYSGSSEYKKAVKSAGFDIDGHVHLGKTFNVSKDNPQTAKCYKGKHIFAYVNSVNLLKTGNYGFVVDNTANLNASSSTTTTAPAKVTGLKATSTTSTLKLSWKKVSGATGYIVYKKTSDGWKKLADVTSTSYTIKKLKAGNKLTLRVRAFIKKNGKTTYGSYSANFVTATKPATPTLKVTSTAAGKATLTWKNVSGESGYQIYYSTKKDSGYKKLTTVKANTAKYTASKLTSGKTYYFRVRAYIKLSSGTVYGGYKTVAVKVKAASSNKLTNAKVADLWKTANKVYNQWTFKRHSEGYVDSSVSAVVNNSTYFLVRHNSIKSVANLKTYLSKYFASDLVNEILNDYIDYNGKLYAAFLGRGAPQRDFKSASVKSQTSNSAQVNLVFYDRMQQRNTTLVQKMKYTSGRWVFTEFFYSA